MRLHNPGACPTLLSDGEERLLLLLHLGVEEVFDRFEKLYVGLLVLYEVTRIGDVDILFDLAAEFRRQELATILPCTPRVQGTADDEGRHRDLRRVKLRVRTEQVHNAA